MEAVLASNWYIYVLLVSLNLNNLVELSNYNTSLPFVVDIFAMGSLVEKVRKLRFSGDAVFSLSLWLERVGNFLKTT